MLYELPPEIISEIASHLSYTDVVAFGKALSREDHRNATNTHAVWLNLATQYLSENPHSDLAKIQSLSSLTTGQLRQRFEKRLMVNDIWRQERELYPSIRRLTEPPCRTLAINIAPGGRWVFGGTANCTVYYWDLESDNPEPLVLAHPDGGGKTPGARCVITGIDFAVDCGDPLSGFVIAFIGCDLRHYYYGKSREWLYIWDVTPQENSTLEAKHVKTLPLPYDGRDSEFSFNEHLAARSMKDRVDVYWWKECTETHLVRCTLLLEKNPRIIDIYVLGYDKILVYTAYQSKYKVRLYALEPEYSQVGEYEKAMCNATKLWSLRFPCQFYASDISRLYFDGTSYRQTISRLGGICALVIQASQVNKATLVRVSNFNLYHGGSGARLYGLGLNKGYCRTAKELCRFGYKGGSTGTVYENGAMLDGRICRILESHWSPSAFDEEMGRLVSASPKDLILHDFSLPVYNIADVCPDTDEVAAQKLQ